MAQIAWTTPAGDLGTYPELREFSFQLEAENPLASSLTYSVISGSLPPGVQLYTNTGLLYGIPNITEPGEPVARKFKFTIRAKNVTNQIADRSFSISINGIAPPTLNTTTESLGTFFDSEFISIVLDYTETNPGTTLEWSVTSGSLPPGLRLSQTGRISGFALAPPAGGPEGTASYDVGRYDEFVWDFEGAALSRTYQFGIRLYDGILSAERIYTMKILAKSFFRADNILISADTTNFFADQDGNQYPTILTQPEELVDVRADRNFAFQFKAYYPNSNVQVYWRVLGSGPAVFDQGAPPVPDDQGLTYTLAPFDDKSFDQSNLSLPPGLILDRETGWLYGGLGTVPASRSTYTFIVAAYVEIPISETDFSIRQSQPIQYTMNILADIDNFITWNTDSDLGFIDNGALSTISISATANRGEILTYSIKSGQYTRFPQGLSLLPSGNISGRTTFDFFSMDRSSFQVIMDDGTTTWDTKYTFTVLAQDSTGLVFDTKEFTLTVRNVNVRPFENLYMKALLPKDLRERFRTTVNNSSLVPAEIVYRSDDPYFGIAKDLKFLAVPGIRASSFAAYIEAMDLFHRNKKITFGTLKLAVAKDANLNVKYEVIYLDVLDYNTQAASNKSRNLSALSTMARITDSGALAADESAQDDYGFLFAGLSIGQDFGAVDESVSVSQLTQNVSFSNSFGNMTGELIDNIGYEYQGAIPEWMSSIQDDTNRPLGFIRAVPLAYLKPGEGKKALFRYSAELEASGFGIQALMNQYAFEADRYLLDRALTINYDPNTGTFERAATTSFDRIPSVGVVDVGPWIRENTGVTNNLRGIDFGADEFVAVGANATILSSRNGTNWTRVPPVLDLSYSAGIITQANIGDSQFNFIYGAGFSLGDELLNQGEYASSQRSYITDIDHYIRLSSPVAGNIPIGTSIEFINFNGASVFANTTTFTSNASSLIFIDNIEVLDRGFALRLNGINVESQANVILKNATTNELRLSANLTNVVPAGTQVTFDDLNGNIVSLITATLAANNTSNLTFTTSTTNVKIGSFATLSNISQGTYVQGLNTNVTVSQSTLNTLPLGTQLFFNSVITANASAGDVTINLSSTERIGLGTAISGPESFFESSLTTPFWGNLNVPGTFLVINVPTTGLNGISPYVGMTVTAPGLPIGSKITSITTLGSNTVINVSFTSSTVTSNPVGRTVTANSVTGPTSASVSTKQTFVGINSNSNLLINDIVLSANISLEDNIRVTSLLANGNIIVNNTDSNVTISTGETIYFVRPTALQFTTPSIVPAGTIVTSKTSTSIVLSEPLKGNVNIGEDQLLTFTLGEIDLNFVLYNGSNWLAVGTRGTILDRDSTGVWNQQFALPYGDIYSIAVTPGVSPAYVIVGNEGLVARSTDFVNWTRLSLGLIVDIHSIEYNDPLFVAVGNAGTILTSNDGGVTWSINNTFTNKNIYSVKFFNNNWIAVGEKGLVMTSVDGFAWNVYTAGVTFTLRDVAYLRNQYFAVGDKGIILESLDGTVWSTRISGQSDDIKSLANNSRFPVLAGSNGLVLTESPNFTVDFAVRGISFEMFNYNTLSQLSALGYPVKEGDTLVFAQQEGFDSTQFRGTSYQNDGWNAFNEIFDDETSSLAYDSSTYDNYTVIPGYVENLLDSTVSNQRAGIWRVALNFNGITYLEFVRQVQFDQIITVKFENSKLIYDPVVQLGNSVPTYRALNRAVNDVTTATVFDENGTRFSEPRDQYLEDPNQHDRYLKFPSTVIQN